MEFFAKSLIGVALVVGIVMLLKEVGKWNPPASSCDVNDTHQTKISGIGGWLLFFVFTLAITGPLMSVGQAGMAIVSAESSNPSIVNWSGWTGAKGILWFFAIASALLSLYAAKELLIKRSRETVSRVIKLLWILGPGMGVLGAIGLWIYFYKMIPEAEIRSINIVSIFGDLFKTAINAAIWTMYLRMSKRVKNTYGC